MILITSLLILNRQMLWAHAFIFSCFFFHQLLCITYEMGTLTNIELNNYFVLFGRFFGMLLE